MGLTIMSRMSKRRRFGELLIRAAVWLCAGAILPIDLAEWLLLLGIGVWSPLITSRDRCISLGCKISHAIAITCAYMSFAFDRSTLAALLAAIWLCWVFSNALRQCRPIRARPPLFWERNIASGFLIVGAIWFVCSRFGFSPLGFPLGITLLTSVHFHFGGWMLPMLMADFVERTQSSLALRALRGVLVSFPMVAIGMIGAPLLELTGVSMLLLSVLLFLAEQGRWSLRQSAIAVRVGGSVALLCGIAALVLAAVYAIAEFRDVIVIPIPVMIATHGLLNAIGVIGGLLLASTPTSSDSEGTEVR